jgi:hypothetical protein
VILKFHNWGFIFLFFLITATNSDAKLYYWFFQSGRGVLRFPYYDFLATFGLAALLLILKYIRNKDGLDLKPEGPGIIIAFALWFVGATFSLTRNIVMAEALKNYISGVITPMVIFLALRGLPLDNQKVNRIFLAVSLGLLTPLILGLAAYFREWGIPSLSILAYSRYNFTRMESYMQVTFGNVGHMAVLLLLIGPPLLVLALDRSRPSLLRIWFGFCLALIGLNLLIVQSITSFFVMLGACLLLIIFRKYYKFLTFASVALMVVGFTFHNLFDQIIYLLMGRQGSLLERVDAIRDGWNIFLGNWVFGVGQGLSYLYIYATTTHQFFIQQGVELGVLGLLASVVLVVIVFSRMLKIITSSSKNPNAVIKFIFIIGPFSYLLYGVITNIPTNIGTVNIWVNLLAAFLALADFRSVPDTTQTIFDDNRPDFLSQPGTEIRKVI